MLVLVCPELNLHELGETPHDCKMELFDSLWTMWHAYVKEREELLSKDAVLLKTHLLARMKVEATTYKNTSRK
jgi:hypothetical protein